MLSEADEDARDAAAAAPESTAIVPSAAPATSPPPLDADTAKKLDHYARICSQEEEVTTFWVAAESAKQAAKEAKGALEKSYLRLRQLINEGRAADRPLPLFDKKEEKATDGGEPKALPAPEWRSRYCYVLVETGIVTLKQCEKLEEAGVRTLGQLTDRWKESDNPLTAIKGIGSETADKFTMAFAKYAETHPEVYGEEYKAQEPATPDPFQEEAVAEAAAADAPVDESDDEPGAATPAAAPAEEQDDPFGDEGEGETPADRRDEVDDSDDADGGEDLDSALDDDDFAMGDED